MKLLIVGGGGREHALAWKLSQSARLTQLFVAPGNAGTAAGALSPLVDNAPIEADNVPALLDLAKRQAIDLAIIGPEAPLAAGLADTLRAAGLRVFGPSQAAAEIESSKSFAKQFMARHGIATGRFAVFADYEDAIDHIHRVDYPVVIKASGLAAGKGVIVPENVRESESALRAMMLNRQFGQAGSEVVIEERLAGEEVSILAFSDGAHAVPMPPAQDHKRLLDGDAGPNTGGMGAYAPAPVCPPELRTAIMTNVIEPAIRGLQQEGRPFVGVLYAGLMLTDSGPRVLEFNCRFGDPETEVILPLLETDLLDIVEACIEGRLSEIDVKWKHGAAACVVAASEGYPGAYPKGRPVSGLGQPGKDAIVFHAGTVLQDGTVVTAGGRVLAVAGLGESVAAAVGRAYAALGPINFEGMQYRKDIGWRAITEAPK